MVSQMATDGDAAAQHGRYVRVPVHQFTFMQCSARDLFLLFWQLAPP